MPQLPNSPDDRRNRKGCFIILGILAVFVALYLFVSFHALPGNDVQQHIQTVPTPAR